MRKRYMSGGMLAGDDTMGKTKAGEILQKAGGFFSNVISSFGGGQGQQQQQYMPPPTNNNLPLYIGGGIAAIGIIYLLTKKKGR